jgi:FkbM family methyltransferase
MTRTFALRKDSNDQAIWNCVVIHNEYRLPNDITGWQVVDIGAHIGTFSRLALDRNAAGVQSFEGNAENYALFCVNAACPRCVSRLAVVHGDAPKEHPLEVARFSWPNTGGGNATPQPGSTVENIHASSLGHQWIDFLKLDCEGFEFDILTSMDLSQVQRIALEFHENATPPKWKKAPIPHTCEALAAHLGQRGFAVATTRHAGSWLGKIFASRTTDWLPRK